MPSFEVAAASIELSRDVVILDTNVLYAAFNEGDSNHLDCKTYLDLPSQLIIPMSVVVETWGLLVGRDKRWDSGFDMLQWIIDPRSGVVVITQCESITGIHSLASQLHIDCVDATILHLADRISKECRLNPPCTVATYDTRDFFRSMLKYHFKLTLLDLRTGDSTELADSI